jgi:CO/xanthine dehydrogenase FAD-binding subunit
VSTTRPLGELLLGPSRTSLRHDEAITEFSFPALGPAHRSAFAKIGSRTAVSVARLSAALVVRFDAAAGTLADVSVALGAVGEVAFRASDLEQSLAGLPADEETARLFAEGCVVAVQQSIPGRHSLPYKQHAAVGLAYDAWNMLALSPPCEPAWA